MMNTKQFIEFLVEGNGLSNNGATAYGSKCNNLSIPVTGGNTGKSGNRVRVVTPRWLHGGW